MGTSGSNDTTPQTRKINNEDTGADRTNDPTPLTWKIHDEDGDEVYAADCRKRSLCELSLGVEWDADRMCVCRKTKVWLPSVNRCLHIGKAGCVGAEDCSSGCHCVQLSDNLTVSYCVCPAYVKPVTQDLYVGYNISCGTHRCLPGLWCNAHKMCVCPSDRLWRSNLNQCVQLVRDVSYIQKILEEDPLSTGINATTITAIVFVVIFIVAVILYAILMGKHSQVPIPDDELDDRGSRLSTPSSRSGNSSGPRVRFADTTSESRFTTISPPRNQVAGLLYDVKAKFVTIVTYPFSRESHGNR